MNRYIVGYNGEMLKEKDCNPQAISSRLRYYEAKEVEEFVLELPQEYWNVFNNWGAGI